MKDDKYVEEKAKELWDKMYDDGIIYRLDNLKDFIRTIVEDCKVKVNRAFIGKVTAGIYCKRKSVYAIKDIVREAFKDAGVEVEE